MQHGDILYRVQHAPTPSRPRCNGIAPDCTDRLTAGALRQQFSDTHTYWCWAATGGSVKRYYTLACPTTSDALRGFLCFEIFRQADLSLMRPAIQNTTTRHPTGFVSSMAKLQWDSLKPWWQSPIVVALRYLSFKVMYITVTEHYNLLVYRCLVSHTHCSSAKYSTSSSQYLLWHHCSKSLVLFFFCYLSILFLCRAFVETDLILFLFTLTVDYQSARKVIPFQVDVQVWFGLWPWDLQENSNLEKLHLCKQTVNYHYTSIAPSFWL